MPAGDDFNRRISSIVAGGYAHEQLLRKYPRLKSLRASRWLVACLRRRRRASAQADARQQCPPETISIVEFHPSWRAVTPMSNSFENIRD
jgi:hypothetical protein